MVCSKTTYLVAAKQSSEPLFHQHVPLVHPLEVLCQLQLDDFLGSFRARIVTLQRIFQRWIFDVQVLEVASHLKQQKPTTAPKYISMRKAQKMDAEQLLNVMSRLGADCGGAADASAGGGGDGERSRRKTRTGNSSPRLARKL